MSFELPSLPYDKNALEPHISSETIEYHYGKHHQTYVTNLNNLVKDTPDAGKSLEDIIHTSTGGIFNNAAQVWNHTFYWNSLTPKSKNKPSGALLSAIEKAFGSFDSFKEKFSTSAATNFGSGWTWLIKNGDGSVSIFNTSNADTPIKHGKKPLLTIDVWEHAYYVDYRNARPKYIESFWKLANWDFAEANYAK
jgi:Fe-Mn family superoxide dismutase